MKTIPAIIVNITRDYMVENLSKLLQMESNWTEIDEKSWNENNFLLDLPYKWELSFAAEDGGEILGYLIGSKSENTTRVNKIAVRREYRKNHVGTSLMRKFEVACLERGLYDVEFKALVDNTPAHNFYTSLGYEKQPLPVKGTDGKMRYVYRKRLK
jgi:ribosomal protein S18 acetylase RimI-like enzyme